MMTTYTRSFKGTGEVRVQLKDLSFRRKKHTLDGTDPIRVFDSLPHLVDETESLAKCEA